MAIYNVKIVDDAGASTTQPIGASSDNVLIQDENISLTQKLENISADRNTLLDQIKKVESRHFTINKHIDSTNVPTGYGFYKIAKLPDGETLATGTEWLISVTENITQVVEMEDGRETPCIITTTSKILFKDGKFTLISFDNEIDLSDELKEQWGTLPESSRPYFLMEIGHDNNTIYLSGMPYSYLFENNPLSFANIGVTFLELSNSSSVSLSKVDFEFISVEESNQINIINGTALNSAVVNKDTSSSFSIDTYEDEGVSMGWYKIAYYDYGNYSEGDCLISVKTWGEYPPQNFNFLLTGAQNGSSYNFIPISQTLFEESAPIVIDKIGFLYYQGCCYIAIHVSEGMQTWSCTVTINNLNFAQPNPDNTYYNEQTLWVAPGEPFGYIGENGNGYQIIAEYVIPNQKFYPLTTLDDAGGVKTISTHNLQSNAWYRIAFRSLFFAPCKISIVEYTDGEMAYCELFCNIIGDSSDSAVNCKTIFQKGNTSFDTVRIMTGILEGFGPTLYIDLHTLTSALSSPNCFITVETICPEFSLGNGFPEEYSHWQTDGIVPIEDNSDEFFISSFDIEKNVQIATTADIDGGGVSDEALAETLYEANSYTDTKVAAALAEAKAYADSLVNGLINGNS